MFNPIVQGWINYYVSLSYNLHPDPTKFCLTPSAAR